MNKFFKYFLLMLILGIFISLSLSLINELTFPLIEEQKIKRVEQSLYKVDNVNKWIIGESLININDDEKIDSVFISIDENQNNKIIAYYLITNGYSNGKIESLVFLDYEKKIILSVDIIHIENQTKGIGSLIQDDPNYVNCFKNMKISKYINDNINKHNSESIDIISGATISSRGVVEAVILACNNFYKNVGKENESIKKY